MICNKKLRIIRYLLILAAMIFFPFHLFAQESKEIVEHETGFYYTVQKGDTLWDLSERFSDSPRLWPELWKDNSKISNPHWIYPGERIRLFHRKGIESFVKKTEETNLLFRYVAIEVINYCCYSANNFIIFICNK